MLRQGRLQMKKNLQRSPFVALLPSCLCLYYGIKMPTSPFKIHLLANSLFLLGFFKRRKNVLFASTRWRPYHNLHCSFAFCWGHDSQRTEHCNRLNTVKESRVEQSFITTADTFSLATCPDQSLKLECLPMQWIYSRCNYVHWLYSNMASGSLRNLVVGKEGFSPALGAKSEWREN